MGRGPGGLQQQQQGAPPLRIHHPPSSAAIWSPRDAEMGTPLNALTRPLTWPTTWMSKEGVSNQWLNLMSWMSWVWLTG